jgi:hypothetical protein
MYEEFDECTRDEYIERKELQNDIEERVKELEIILQIKDFEEMKKRALEYEKTWLTTDIREDSTKEEIIDNIEDEIRYLQEDWKELN